MNIEKLIAESWQLGLVVFFTRLIKLDLIIEVYYFYSPKDFAAALWSNGKTADSGSVYRGSNPCGAAIIFTSIYVNNVGAFSIRFLPKLCHNWRRSEGKFEILVWYSCLKMVLICEYFTCTLFDDISCPIYTRCTDESL